MKQVNDDPETGDIIKGPVPVKGKDYFEYCISIMVTLAIIMLIMAITKTFICWFL